MPVPGKYKFIAAFLLIVFSLNTLAGFACSIGINLGYNSTHHNLEKKANVNANFKHGKNIKSCHRDNPDTNNTESGKDCCSDQVNSFAQLDKSVASNFLLLQAPVFFITPLTNFTSVKNELGITLNSQFQLVRRSSLNDTDIRIAIQSFLI
jgi:hypothetical protein